MTIHDPRYSDVIIIGGGATGAGIARDCALRGLSVTLLERHDIATGATGRNHGLLHSGARYAVTDGESARECIAENQILRRIARHCVEQTKGLFITLPEDDLAFQQTFIRACTAAGITAEALDPAEARLLEPSVNPSLVGAVNVPDDNALGQKTYVLSAFLFNIAQKPLFPIHEQIAVSVLKSPFFKDNEVSRRYRRVHFLLM